MIEFKKVTKSYSKNAPVLQEVDVAIKRGDWLVVQGNSGEGKTTFLKLIAGLTRPDKGEIKVNSHDIARMKIQHLPYFRRRIGFVFQETMLLEEVTVLHNVMHPLLIQGVSFKEARERGRAALSQVGIEKWSHHGPLSLSGGQQQLLSIARAIVSQPDLIITDEPTANLDRTSAQKIIDILRSFHAAGTTCIISTHDDFYFIEGDKVALIKNRNVEIRS